MPSGIDLLDVNVWLALTAPHHAHHQRAQQYWTEEARNQVAFCRVSALGYLRLCTNGAVMAGHPLTVAQAWQSYTALRQLPEVLLMPEPDACEAQLADWVSAGVFQSKHLTDAYLAAFAAAANGRLVSFDRDFGRFPGLEFHHLRA